MQLRTAPPLPPAENSVIEQRVGLAWLVWFAGVVASPGLFEVVCFVCVACLVCFVLFVLLSLVWLSRLPCLQIGFMLVGLFGFVYGLFVVLYCSFCCM